MKFAVLSQIRRTARNDAFGFFALYWRPKIEKERTK